jgi:hypothetical protein
MLMVQNRPELASVEYVRQLPFDKPNEPHIENDQATLHTGERLGNLYG